MDMNRQWGLVRDKQSCVDAGGVNPGTPAYVGDLCIILHHQKHTSRYICITPLLVKLAYFLPPKKIWCDTHVSFFSARTKYVRAQSCAEARSGQNQNFFFRAFRTFSSCLLHSVPLQLLTSSCKLSSFAK